MIVILLNIIVFTILVLFQALAQLSYAADWNLLLLLPSLTLVGFSIQQLIQENIPIQVWIFGSLWLSIGFVLQFKDLKQVWATPNFARYSIASRLKLIPILSDFYKSLVTPMRWGWLPLGIVFLPFIVFASLAKTIADPKAILLSQGALIFVLIWIGIALLGMISKAALTAPGLGMIVFLPSFIYLPTALFLNLVFGAVSIFEFVSPAQQQFLIWFFVSIGWPMGIHFGIALAVTIAVRFRSILF